MLLLAQGCVVIPVGHQPEVGFVDEKRVAELRASGFSRADVLLRLGEPDRRYLEDRVLGYLWTETIAWVFVGGPGAVGGTDVWETRILLVEFDADGRLRRAEVLDAIQGKTLEQRIRDWLAQVP